MEKNSVFEYEDNHLKDVIKILNSKIEETEKKFNDQKNFIIGFKEGQRGTQFTRQSLMSLYATELNKLRSIISNPYFGKFVFSCDENNCDIDVYIGKSNIMDDNNNIICYDWRNPISSMYYDFNIGDAYYLHDGKKNSGVIKSKRQFQIKNGKLIKVDEQDTLNNDKILIEYLNENLDSRLKSIIATIQKEQNKIIRSNINSNYIIQGVAGSGKTTVALHRIAYLLYNEAKNMKSSNFVILGPNKFFLNFISDLLPDLDIVDIYQTTFEDIAFKNIKGVKLENNNTILERVLKQEENIEELKFKNSIEYLKMLEMFVKRDFSNNINKALEIDDIVLMSKEKIESYFQSSNYSISSINDKIKNFTRFFKNYIKENCDDICSNIWGKYRDEYLSLDKNDSRRNEILDIVNKYEEEIKKGCPNILKDYFKFSNKSYLDIYKDFINDLNIDTIKDRTLIKLNKKIVTNEDLTALLLISILYKGNDDYGQISHLVIDEAQDISLAQYYVLKMLFKNAKFDVYGDINQSIYSYKSNYNWDELNKVLFDSKAIILNLNKSYRTTLDISNVSNLVLSSFNNEQECVAREGKKVEIEESNNNISEIINKISDMLNNGLETIAIICKDKAETEALYKKLKKAGLNINIINDKNNQYNGGVCVLPVYLSKGLEFDGVIIYNANTNNYKDNNIDLKLLYVAITRAMHELCIYYSDTITNSLRPLLDTKEKVLVKDNK